MFSNLRADARPPSAEAILEHLLAASPLDGQKKFFRKRGWVRSFFGQNGAAAGQTVVVEEVGAYRYRVRLIR